MALLLASACSAWPLRSDDARDHLDYLARAMTTGTAEREAMWKSVVAEGSGDSTLLRRSLMQSVPGHSGFDARAAEAGLAQLVKRDPDADIAAVARVRLEELRAARDMREQVRDLEQRLSRVVDIERRSRSNGKDPK